MSPNVPETGELQIPGGSIALSRGQLAATEGSKPALAQSPTGIFMALSMCGYPTGCAGTQGTFTKFKALFSRWVVPISGSLKDISVLNGGTLNGEVRVAILDTGDAKEGEYTILGESAAETQTGKEKWQSFGALGEPALTAGQHVMVGIMTSTETGKYFFNTNSAGFAGAFELPSGYLKVKGGALPKLVAAHTFSELKFTSLTEAEMEVGTVNTITMIGRIG